MHVDYTVQETKYTIHALFITIHALFTGPTTTLFRKKLKIGPMELFIYLKIILL